MSELKKRFTLLRTAFDSLTCRFLHYMPRTQEANSQVYKSSGDKLLLLLSLIEKATWLSKLASFVWIRHCLQTPVDTWKKGCGRIRKRIKETDESPRGKHTWEEVLKKASHVTCLSLDTTGEREKEMREMRFSSNSLLPTIAIRSSNWRRKGVYALDTLNEFGNSKRQ